MPEDPPFKSLVPEESASSLSEHTVRVQQLFVKHQSAIKAYILSLQPDFAEADDILQEVFLVLTRKADSFQEGSYFMGWVLTIARLKVLEALRRKKAAEMAFSQEVIETLSECRPDERYFELRAAAVRLCLERLAPRMQEVVKLRYFDEHKPREIARLLSWTPNSVNVALSKARKIMHDCVNRQLQKA